MFGEIVAFAGIKLWPSTVYAERDASILYIQPQKVLGICDKACAPHKILISNILNLISNKAFLLNKKVEYLTIKSIKGKLSKYLMEQYKKAGNLTFSIELNREELADFLNVSRPSMSRELCKIRDEGIIEFYRETIKIIDIAKLQKILE
jgi:CRP-like cAMP-binding protein